MAYTKKQFHNTLITNFKQVLSFILFITMATVQLSSLEASTVYTSPILDEKTNESPFVKPIKSENINKVKALIKSGCDVNESNSAGYTPLMAAVFQGNVEIIKILIEAGAELESYDNQGNTPFMYAFYGTKQKKAAVKLLLNLNVNLEIMNIQEQTPLILATLNNHCDSMKLLFAAGINIETKGKEGSTALMQAVENQNIEPAKLLIKNGANFETRDDWSFTPLMSAAFRNDGTMIRLLLEAGVDINARTTKSIPVALKKDYLDFFPQTVYIPEGSTALDIAKQFDKRFAEHVLINGTKK